MHFEDAVASGWSAATRGDPQPTIDYFTALLAQYPGDPRALFEMGTAYDWSGRPDQAEPMYARALAGGLIGDRLRRGMLQHGNTLRNLGRAAEGAAVLERTNALFPGNDAVRAYLALALLSAGHADEAVAEMIDVALDSIQSEDLQRYHWGLRHYAAALRRGYWSAADDDGRGTKRSP